MNTRMPTVMELTEIEKILGTLHPLPYGRSVGDAWVLDLQESEVDRILHGEFYVPVVELKSSLTLTEIDASIDAELARSGRPSPPLERFEIVVERVFSAGRVRGVVETVAVFHALVVRVRHPYSHSPQQH